MKKIWINKTDSFLESERFDKNYYLGMSGQKKVEVVQFLREQYFKIKGLKEENRRLHRVIKIKKQKKIKP